MINIFLTNGKVLVWKSEDVLTLRKKYRIVGSLIGSYPLRPFQAHEKWLPLLLMDEEARLLLDEGIAKLISKAEVIDPAETKNYYNTRNELCRKQKDLLKEHRRQEILSKQDVICAGVKRRLKERETKAKLLKGEEDNKTVTDAIADVSENLKSVSDPVNVDHSNLEEISSKELSDDDIMNAQISKIKDFDQDQCSIQLFTESPWKSTITPANWSYPHAHEKLKYLVFRDLWRKGYYITTGMKFGGHFLVYEGDPFKYHAKAIVLCKNKNDNFTALEICTYGRLGHQVKKTFILASVTKNEKIIYNSISWEKDMMPKKDRK